MFVFVLQLERDTAVLLDEHYNARALEDMVLVVANSARRCGSRGARLSVALWVRSNECAEYMMLVMAANSTRR